MPGISRLAKFTIGYTLLIGLWVAVRFIFKDRVLPVAVVNTLAEYLFVPLPVFMLLCLIGRERWGGMLLVPGAVFFYFWGAQYLPGGAPDPGADTAQIRVMTFNIQGANEAPELLIHAITPEAPDLIGFQEISHNNLPALERDLAAEYPFNTFDLYDGRRSDVGVASRYPILSYERMVFPPRDAAVHAVVDWNGVQVHVFVLHFSADNLFEFSVSEYPALERENLADRAREVTIVGETLEEVDGPVLVLCDCNFTDTTETYRRMAAWLGDSFKRVGWGPGHTLDPFQKHMPMLRIDYVWYNAAFLPIASHRGDPQSSDHYPVISVLGFPNE
jgi:endonuclease/exonuclease/phosphatase (EEP) superfamily protein YafD